MIEVARKIINVDKFKRIAIATFICGLVAHAYVFLNAMYIQDSAGLFNNMSLRAIFNPERMTPLTGLWSYLLGDTKLPWINGLIVLGIYAFSSYLTCEILEIQSDLIRIAIACILVINPAFISSNLYTVSIEFSVALLFSVLGTFFVLKDQKRYKLLGFVFMFLCLGTYGPYISWSLSLMVLIKIRYILSDYKLGEIFKQEIKSVLGYLGVLVALLIFCALLKGQNQDRVDHAFSILYDGTIFISFLEQIKNTVLSYVPDNIVNMIGATRGFNSDYSGFFIENRLLVVLYYIAIVLTIIAFFCILRRSITKLLVLLLHLIVLIMVRDLFGIVTQSHTLMQFAYITPWILILMTGDILQNYDDNLFHKVYKAAVVVLSVFTVISGILLANTAYMKEENTYIASLMLSNRIADKVESVDGYVPGTTEVWFIGDIQKYYANEQSGFARARDIMGVRSPFFDCGIIIPINMENYLVEHAKLNMKFALEPNFMDYDNPEVYYDIFRRNGHDVQVDEFVDAYNAAATFPNNNCAFWCDGVLIFKLGSYDY
ncbi:glucosyltransferase domain-containing protein [Butyrivibrio fibrisolvens]|uniref:glucosyltransferase domain-containing protein n=1 Tax=Butyrivibrio fibrisolvens TaxID=831 RepID=UPI0003B78B9F|nr:glucosyltransferase domain-containing protein [Butyrivibrio fibrisolvens]